MGLLKIRVLRFDLLWSSIWTAARSLESHFQFYWTNLYFSCFEMNKSVYPVLRLAKETPGELTFRRLNGLFCFYKPPDMDLYDVFGRLRQYLVSGINELPCRPIENIVKVDDESDQICIRKNFADSVEG